MRVLNLDAVIHDHFKSGISCLLCCFFVHNAELHPDDFRSDGDSVINKGRHPLGMSSTVNPDGSVSDNGGSNPASGYGLIEADVVATRIVE